MKVGVVKSVKPTTVQTYPMPEGPEVATIVTGLSHKLKYQAIHSISCIDPAKYFKLPNFKSSSFHPRDEFDSEGWCRLQDALPVRVRRVFCNGKNIYFQFRSLASSGKDPVEDIYLHCHLRMTGRWSSESDPQVKLLMRYQPGHRVHGGKLILPSRSEISKLYFHCSRGLARFLILTPTEVQHHMRLSGPDLLKISLTQHRLTLSLEQREIFDQNHAPVMYGAQDFSFEEWQTLIKRSGNSQLVSFLMKQEKVAGVGNYIKAEVLFACRLHPKRKVNSLSLEQSKALYEACLNKLCQSYLAQGLTIRSYFAVDGTKGRFRCLVYGQTHYTEGEVKYMVRTENFADGRTTHWIPELQF